jgi:hypothetical protein
LTQNQQACWCSQSRLGSVSHFDFKYFSFFSVRLEHVVDQITTQESARICGNASGSYHEAFLSASFCLQHFFSSVAELRLVDLCILVSLCTFLALVTTEALKIYGLVHGNREGKLVFLEIPNSGY